MLNWGLIGAGGIARVFANGMRFSKTGRIVAVASQTAGKAEQLAGDFGIPKAYSSYEALLADAEVQAVYISTIHPFHAACAIQAAEAGKHILVEKPIAMNAVRSRVDDRGGARQRRLSDGSVHVSLPSSDTAAG